MYAFISNEYKTIVKSVQQLDFLMSIYSYPKFKKVFTTAEAKAFFANNDREYMRSNIVQSGKRNKVGYISIEYYIDGENIYYNVHTEHFGFIKLQNIPSNVKIDSQYDLMKIKVCNVVLNNDLIAHHCIAIQQALKIFGNYVNIEIIIPSISVYLALTKYTGTNFAIKNAQGVIKGRLAETYYTVREDYV